MDWHISNSNGSPCKEGLEKFHADHQHQDEGLSSLHAQHSALQQWSMDSVLNAFHLCCLRRILGITWQDFVPNKNALGQVGIWSMFALLNQRFLHWLGHVSCMQDGQIPKDVLYGEFATGSTPAGRPVHHFKGVCKWDLKADNINSAGWEAVSVDHITWSLAVKAGIQMHEQRREDQWEVRKEHRWQRTALATTQPGTDYTCSNCNRACHSGIGLYSHSRHWNSITD